MRLGPTALVLKMLTAIEPQIRTARGIGLEDLADLITADVETALLGSAEGLRTLFVPPESRIPDMLSRLLVPHDGTPSANGTLEQAVTVAARVGAEVVLLYVAGTELPTEAGSLPVLRFTDHAGYDWAEWRHEFYHRFVHSATTVRTRLEVAFGPTTKSITEAARRLGADLLVLGSHEGGIQPRFVPCARPHRAQCC